jgi:hypothetical protein
VLNYLQMTDSVTIYQNSDRSAQQLRRKRRRKLVRASTEEMPPLRLTKRDIAVINACYEYRALTTTQIQQLFFSHNNTRSQLVQCQYRLKLLYHHEYVYRDEQPTKLSEGHRSLVYFLDRKGALLLAECLGVDPSELDWHPKNNAAGAGHLFIDHLLKTNDIRIAVALATEQEHANLECWLDDKTLKSRQVKEYVKIKDAAGDERRVAVIPDGYFHLQIGKYQHHHFLEADLRTVTGFSSKSGRRDWAKKIRTYLAYHESGQFQERYQAQSFRVLTVTTGERRLENLKRITEEAGGKSRFWFTTFDRIAPGTVLSQPIWQVAGREGEYSLTWEPAA